MEILNPVGCVITTVVTLAGAVLPIASPKAIGGIRNGRHTVEVYNKTGSPIYIGGADLAGVSNGIPIAAGASRAFPVNRTAVDCLCMFGTGDVIIAEYYS